MELSSVMELPLAIWICQFNIHLSHQCQVSPQSRMFGRRDECENWGGQHVCLRSLVDEVCIHFGMWTSSKIASFTTLGVGIIPKKATWSTHAFYLDDRVEREILGRKSWSHSHLRAMTMAYYENGNGNFAMKQRGLESALPLESHTFLLPT